MTGQTSNVPPGPSATAGAARAKLARWLAQPAAEAAGVALVLALGAYLRLAHLDFAQFRVDDFTLWSIARGLAEQPRILTQGMDSSLGLANGPFQAYLLLPAALLGAHPLPAYYLVALLNVLGVGLFWGFVRRYWGAGLALAATLLFAANPWAVVFSRRLLGNDLVAPFTILLVWSLCDLARHGRRRDSVLPFLWLAIGIQVYVVGLVHLVLAAVGLALGARRLQPGPTLVGVLLSALLTAPYLGGTVLPDLGSLSRLVGQPGTQATVDSTSFRYLFQLVSTEGYQVFASQAGEVVDATRGLPRAASLLAQAFLAVGLVAGVAQAARRLRRRDPSGAAPYILPAVATLLPSLLLVRHAAPIYTLYLVTALPMPYLFVALGAREIWRAPGLRSLPVAPLARPLSAAALGLVVAVQLSLATVFFAVIREYWPASDYGLPLRYTFDVGATITRLLDEQGFARAYVAGSGERDAVLYGTLRSAAPSLAHFNAGDTFVAPAPGAGRVLYVLSSTEHEVGRAFAEHLSGAEVASVDVPGPGLRYSLYSAAAADLDAVLAALAPSQRPPARVGDYLDLVGYDLSAETPVGGKIGVGLQWQVLARPAREISLFGHLIGGLGSAWGQWDGFRYSPEQWQAGDRVVEWHELAVPAGAPPVEYQVEAGAYDRASGQRLPVRIGQETQDRLRLGTVRVARPAAPARPAVETLVDARFGDGLRLLGYDLSSRTPGPGEPLRLTLYWESLAPEPVDYTVFNHLAREDGRPLAQADGPPAFGAFATSAWRAGDLVRDPHELALPADLPPGRYWLLTGLYDPRSGARLAPVGEPASPLARLGRWLERRTAFAAGPRVDGDHVVLATVDVGGSGR